MDSVYKYVFVAALAGVSGFLRHLYADYSSGKPVSLKYLVIDTLSSSMVGVIVYLYAHSEGLEGEALWALVGLSGHIGVSLLDLASDTVKRKYKL